MAGLEGRDRDTSPKLGAGSVLDILERMKSWFKGNF
jgi:cell division protein FtsA